MKVKAWGTKAACRLNANEQMKRKDFWHRCLSYSSLLRSACRLTLELGDTRRRSVSPNSGGNLHAGKPKGTKARSSAAGWRGKAPMVSGRQCVGEGFRRSGTSQEFGIIVMRHCIEKEKRANR